MSSTLRSRFWRYAIVACVMQPAHPPLKLSIQATKTYFEEESTKYLAENSLPDYMKQVHARVQQEDERVQRSLHQSTSKKLGTTVGNRPCWTLVMCPLTLTAVHGRLDQISHGPVCARARYAANQRAQ